MKCGLIIANCYKCTDSVCTVCKATYILSHDQTLCLTDCSLDDSIFYFIFFFNFNNLKCIFLDTWFDSVNN